MYSIGPNSCGCKKARFCCTSLNVPNVFQHSGDDAKSFIAKSTKCIEDNDKVVYLGRMSDSENLLLLIDQKLDMSGDIVLKYCDATLITITDEGLKITVH